MFATRKARERLRATLLAILIVAVSLVAPYLTYVAKVYEQPYPSSFNYANTVSLLIAVATTMWLADLVIASLLISYLVTVTLPRWASQGEAEPLLPGRKTTKALLADKARLLSELEEVPTLREEVKQLRAQLAEFQDPPRTEVHGYAQPPFTEPSFAGSGGRTVNPSHGAGE